MSEKKKSSGRFRGLFNYVGKLVKSHVPGYMQRMFIDAPCDPIDPIALGTEYLLMQEPASAPVAPEQQCEVIDDMARKSVDSDGQQPLPGRKQRSKVRQASRNQVAKIRDLIPLMVIRYDEQDQALCTLPICRNPFI